AQKEWLQLASIFGVSEDMRRQMAKEARDFSNVNAEWERIVKQILADKLVLHTSQIPQIVIRCTDVQKKLEIIKNSLNKFLEDKRMLFPRFYFLSDDDLLKILGHARDPQAVRPHLKKCFCSLNDLYFASERKATKMYSLEGEEVSLSRQLNASGAVEAWLAELENIMCETIRKEIMNCHNELVNTYKGKKREWILNNKLQMLLAAGQIYWTAQIENVLNNAKLIKNEIKRLRIEQQILLNLLTKIISTERLSFLDRLKLVSLITIEDHAREVLHDLAHNRVKSTDEFLWKQQLKFYKRNIQIPIYAPPTQQQGPQGPGGPGAGASLKGGAPDNQPPPQQLGPPEDHVIVESTNWQFRYGYEYLGCTERLVITPLTDRCYTTLVTAMYLKLGGNPQGPAGTGKTETVKDLSKALGMYCIIFNCSEGLDQNSMGRMFSGLAQCGAWSCFDEFNRIGVEVLSVVAQQLQEVMGALEASLTNFLFEGKQIPIKESCGVFVTMNPGYAGRSELPDNLKALFRPVAMMVPDSAMIARIRLYSEGFRDSSSLDQKVDTLYQLSMQQLSRQSHYDWGLRAIKSVLVTAGTYHRQASDQSEDVVLYRACMNMNFPKLLADDLRLFQGLLNDLFPNVSLPQTTSSVFIDNIKETIKESPEHWQQHQPLLNKILQFSETKDIRHGVMIVGQSGSYKSTVWKILQRAKIRLNAQNIVIDPLNDPNTIYPKVQTNILNPKAVTNDELFGYFDKTPEWHDGIVSNLVMRAANETTLDEKWIVFDGPVDTLWIESMNSVLDDSKVLTLTNQARITFPTQVSFVFEVEDLQEASPATVSRCGIIFMDAAEFGYIPYFQAWIQGKDKYGEKYSKMADYLRRMIEKNFPKALKVRSESCKELIKTSDLNSAKSFTRLYDALATKENGLDLDNAELNTNRCMDMMFVFCLVWSVGATIDDASRKVFDEFVHSLDPSIPPQETVYEYCFDISKLAWMQWEARFPIANWKPAPDMPYHRILVPTVDTVRHEYLIKALTKNAYNVLMIGTTGTGKSAMATALLGALNEKQWIPLSINFSAQTLSSQVQETIESRTDKRGKKYSPIGGKRMMTFIDDLNMPAHDTYHSQPPLEILRQWIDYSGWYNRKDKETSFILVQ
ncbi:MAG: putative Dynein heavy chain, partial [Streblomastix strix]